jgi:hypothetical protein
LRVYAALENVVRASDMCVAVEHLAMVCTCASDVKAKPKERTSLVCIEFDVAGDESRWLLCAVETLRRFHMHDVWRAADGEDDGKRAKRVDDDDRFRPGHITECVCAISGLLDRGCVVILPCFSLINSVCNDVATLDFSLAHDTDRVCMDVNTQSIYVQDTCPFAASGTACVCKSDTKYVAYL